MGLSAHQRAAPDSFFPVELSSGLATLVKTRCDHHFHHDDHDHVNRDHHDDEFDDNHEEEVDGLANLDHHFDQYDCDDHDYDEEEDDDALVTFVKTRCS